MEPFNLCVGGVGWCEEATLSGAVSRDAQWLRLGVYLTLSEFICLPKPVSLDQIYEPKQILMNQAELVSTRSVFIFSYVNTHIAEDKHELQII